MVEKISSSEIKRIFGYAGLNKFVCQKKSFFFLLALIDLFIFLSVNDVNHETKVNHIFTTVLSVVDKEDIEKGIFALIDEDNQKIEDLLVKVAQEYYVQHEDQIVDEIGKNKYFVFVIPV